MRFRLQPPALLETVDTAHQTPHKHSQRIYTFSSFLQLLFFAFGFCNLISRVDRRVLVCEAPLLARYTDESIVHLHSSKSIYLTCGFFRLAFAVRSIKMKFSIVSLQDWQSEKLSTFIREQLSPAAREWNLLVDADKLERIFLLRIFICLPQLSTGFHIRAQVFIIWR
jgi:hypothetical protein